MGQRFVLEQLNSGSKSNSYIPLVVAVLFLVGIGLAMLLSSSYYRGSLVFSDPYYFFKNQLAFLGVGLAGAIFLAVLPTEFIRKSVPFLIIGTLVLLGLVFIPGVGLSLLGGRRWISLFSMTFQPSELAKITIILYLAFLLAKKQDRLEDLINTVLPPLILVGVIFGLVVLQNDYSTGMFILLIGFVMLFAAGVKVLHLLGLLLLGIPLAAVLLLSKESRVERLISFVAPELDPIGAGYQVLSSQAALVSGGLSGRGIGQGIRKLGGLPEANSDYIFAVIGEELGFVGVVFVVVLFAFFAVAGYRIALRNGRSFSGLAAFGLTSLILFQALTNIAVVSGLLPPTGVTLPFFSSGGSSLLMSLAAVGLIVNFSRQPAGGDNG